MELTEEASKVIGSQGTTASEKMDDIKLAQIIDAEIHSAVGYEDGELSGDRQFLLNRYYGEPYGNEVEGQSQVLTREVFETVEQLMPSFMRIFASGTEIAKFDPIGPGDEQQAEQETEYVNHVFFKDNNGYEILHTWIKDALLQRNGSVKVYWEANDNQSKETYEGLTQEQLMMLLSDPKVEPLEFTPNEDGTADIKVSVQEGEPGKIVVENVPPEEFYVSKDLRSTDYRDPSCDFVCHKVRKSVSQLISEGFDKDIIMSLRTGEENANFFGEAVNRRKLEDEYLKYEDEGLDPSNRTIWVDDVYMKVDFDNDGITELRHVIKVGNKILENEEATEIPFETITPIIMGHKWVGLSAADMVVDLQEQSTTLRRQMFNNLYNVNMGRTVVNEDTINMDDLLSPVTHGVVRNEGDPSSAVVPLAVPPVLNQILPALDSIQEERYGRTGQSRGSAGADADVLAQSTKGAFEMALEKSEERPEMMARNFAEGIKRLMLHIHRLILEHQDFARTIKLKNEWIPIDPTMWRKRDRMEVTVGLGTGNKDAQLARLWALADKQEQHLMNQSPLVTPENLYNTYDRVITTSGLRDTEMFFTNPMTNPQQPQQEQPDPSLVLGQMQMQIEQGKQQLQAQKQQIDAEAKAKELQLKEFEASLHEREVALKEFEMPHKLEIDAAKVPGQQSIEQLAIEKEFEASENQRDREAKLQEALIKQTGDTERKILDIQNQAELNSQSQQEAATKPKSKTVSGTIGDRNFSAKVKDD